MSTKEIARLITRTAAVLVGVGAVLAMIAGPASAASAPRGELTVVEASLPSVDPRPELPIGARQPVLLAKEKVSQLTKLMPIGRPLK